MKADPTRDYLQSIGSVPLLTKSEEIELGRLVQRRQKLIETFPGLEDSADIAAAAAAAENLSKARLRAILRSGKKAKDRMIAANLRLCVSLATKSARKVSPSLEMVDLAQEGALGLIRAVEMFDPERGYKFSTFAYWHIRQRIGKAISQQSATIRIPMHIREDLAKIQKIQFMAAIEGRSLTVADAARQIGVNPALIESALMTKTLSLNCLLSCSTDTELGDMLPAPAETPSLLSGDQIDFIRACIDTLPGDRPQVIRSAFAITNNDEVATKCNNAEIGAQLGFTRSRTWELRQDSFARLRVMLGDLSNEL